MVFCGLEEVPKTYGKAEEQDSGNMALEAPSKLEDVQNQPEIRDAFLDSIRNGEGEKQPTREKKKPCDDSQRPYGR